MAGWEPCLHVGVLASVALAAGFSLNSTVGVLLAAGLAKCMQYHVLALGQVSLCCTQQTGGKEADTVGGHTRC